MKMQVGDSLTAFTPAVNRQTVPLLSDPFLMSQIDGHHD
jgi:hypothetical protein